MSDISETEVVVSGVGPQPGECLRDVHAGSFGDQTFGLLDDDPACQGIGELLAEVLRFDRDSVLHDAHAGQVSETLGDDNIVLGHRGLFDAEEVEGADGDSPPPQRQRER